MLYYDKEIYFIGLYTPINNTKFFYYISGCITTGKVFR